ncbi:MAG: ATP-binding protein [Saprospirales bacterium]|nr:MAG: ATP-binding protein [Saprospirales bacterium]
MELLIEKSDRKAKEVRDQQRRYLYEQIEWNQRLIVILGYRGAGKTTLLLQYLSNARQRGIYLSLDDFYFETHRLVNLIESLYKKGFRLFLLDEVHRYAWWSKDLKQLYDDYDDIQVVATGSSILDISKGNADLSRRASVYHLHGLSFREYLNFQKNIGLEILSLEEILNEHHVLAPELLDTFNFKSDFQDYLKFGYLPFFLESKKTYHQKLQETIHLVIDTDIAPFEELQHSTTRILKKLLFVLSESVPFTPNIKKLSEKLETPRNTVLRLLDILDRAQILQLLRSSTKGVSYLQKPEKIYLGNPNFIYLFSPKMANIGNVRETFFFNQLRAVHSVTASKFGDFMVDETWVFEVGGASKTTEQIQGIPNAYLALDIDGGSNRRIPLWLFGMLY